MKRVDPALADRASSGLLGMLLWGASSSVLAIMGPMFLGGPLFMYDAGILVIVAFGALIAVTIAAVVWGLGGLVLALPIWLALIAAGARGWRLALSMICAGALAVGAIWAWFLHAPIGSSGFWLAMGLGAISGAFGGYGFCRSAMRS
jgi:hypothetical protein